MRPVIAWCLLVVSLAPMGCTPPPKPAPTEVVLHAAPTLPSDPADPAWQAVPEFVAPLIPQDLVEPRLMKPSTAEVRVRALQRGDQAAFRLEWDDPTKNDTPKPDGFYDACAVQMPLKTEATVPAPQMGEAMRGVEITYWNANWQSIVDGRGDTLKDLYPNSKIDHYPFEAASLEKGSAAQKEMAARYSPARALGNNMGGPRTVPVQDLLAEGPGTISPAKETTSAGRGTRTATGWTVVLTRHLTEGLATQPRSQVAFAVWQGETQEVGARKMRTGWIPLAKGGTP